MKKLTPTQQEVLNFVRQYYADNRVMPTRPEIAKAFKRTTQNRTFGNYGTQRGDRVSTRKAPGHNGNRRLT